MVDKLQRYVCQYFSEIMIDTSRNLDSDLEEEMGGFESCHNLLLEVFKTAEGVLLNVIPQLEEELKVLA